MPIDVAPLWDYDKPEVSERRFRAALATAAGDDVLIIQTQIARTFGLRGEFAQAREVLRSIEHDIAAAGPEARARYALELGRTYASATHPQDQQTVESKQQARTCFERALAIARTAELDALAIDAIHMLAFVDTAPSDQLKWAQQALSVVEASSQPAAKKWEASIRNNMGYALHQLGRYDAALDQFERAVELRKREGDPASTRVAYWMVAWTLRAMGRNDEALAIQLRLEQEADAAGAPDPYVYEELEILYRARQDDARARHYAELKQAISG
jgi:tetratricopeptide (TPR) repeat protein